jgi:hypothetical protein
MNTVTLNEANFAADVTGKERYTVRIIIKQLIRQQE